MTDKSGFATLSRRDAIRLIAATPASGAALATSLPGAASATSAASAAHLPPGSAPAPQGLVPQGLADLAMAHFEPLVGETFLVGGDAVTLTEVRRGPASGARFRQQFALTFSVPQLHPMPSETVSVSHPAIGSHELHVAPVGGSVLEICFS